MLKSRYRIKKEIVMLPYIILGAVAFIVAAVALTSYICFYRIFYFPARRRDNREFPLPPGRPYEPYHEQMIEWMKEFRALPHRDVSITSHDGLRLCGKFFEYAPDAPVEIMFHGYLGSGLRDLSGGVARCHLTGHSALVVDHRSAGESEGKIISFGINERRDCERWVRFVANELCPNSSIILTGISMGAATVLMASANELPSAVIGVLADCGYTSAKDIIKLVMKRMHLPADILYPFARLGARIYGGFDLEEGSPMEAMRSCKLPVLFAHGDADDFVPHFMSVQNFEACTSENKKLLTIHGAGHGLCFPADKEGYIAALKEFFDPLTEHKTLN